MADDEKDNDIIPTERFTPEPETEGDKQQQSGNGGSNIPLMINGNRKKRNDTSSDISARSMLSWNSREGFFNFYPKPS